LARGLEELLAIDVRIARDGREVGVAEVLRYETRVAELPAQPGCRCVSQRVGGDVFLDAGALGGAADDVGEDRLLESSAGEPAEDRVGRRGLAKGLEPLTDEADATRVTEIHILSGPAQVGRRPGATSSGSRKRWRRSGSRWSGA
jgi:hypothetical protein